MDRRPGDPPRREVVVHVDADVLAEDTAAGRAHYQGGPAITAAQARRLLCEAAAVMMIEKGTESLAVGRRKRRATKAQRRALLRRGGGCARPGCPETRIERLHAHHMRHWLYGGRTDLTNLVLLCDTDHGLVLDHDLVLTRRNGRLIVTTPDGEYIWGTADAAFTAGLPGAHTDQTADAAADRGPFLGVHPIDTIIGWHPVADAPPVEHDLEVAPSPGRPLRRRPSPPRRPGMPRPGRRRTAAQVRPLAGPGVRPTGRPVGPGPSKRPPLDRPERAPASATCSSPTANPRSPTRCRNATSAWTWASPSLCSWATATSPDASPPKQACPRGADPTLPRKQARRCEVAETCRHERWRQR